MANQAQVQVLKTQLREMEVAAFEARREVERELAKALLRTGAIVGAGVAVRGKPGILTIRWTKAF